MATLFAFAALFAHHALSETEGLRCKEVVFNVSGTAQNRNISSVDFTDLKALTAALKEDKFDRFEVSGEQKIAGWYCEPSKRIPEVDKLQILLGPITTNREYWTAQGGTPLNSPPLKPYKPELYSWTNFANAQGYATLTLDHLGNGRSSHPEPMNVVQSPYEIALYHDVVRQIKAGPLSSNCPLPRPFDRLAWVGASYGSVIATRLAQEHPMDFEEYILTGFTKTSLDSLPGVAAQGAKPARMFDRKRFGKLPEGYLVDVNATTRTESFFGDPKHVNFEPEVAKLFFERQDVVSVGQFVSTYVDIAPAPAYRGRVLVLTGEQDQAFCGKGSSAIDPNPSCGKLLAETEMLFQNAEYNYQSIPRSGHALILHKSANQTLKTAHDFLAGEKFRQLPVFS